MPDSDHARAHVIVRGRVQGVWYRDSTRTMARKLGLTGWVKNRPDGAVEAAAEGPRETVEALIGWLHQGPPLARVDDVEVDWQTPRGEFDDFNITW